MLYAISNGEKIQATKSGKGKCPLCGDDLIPRCGEINIHHWSHKKNHEGCDLFSEPETPWHLMWKSRFPRENTEVIIEKNGKRHIADYYNKKSNVTVEFQYSPLPYTDRIEREAFYPNLQWVVHTVSGRLINEDRFSTTANMRWLHPKRWISTNTTLNKCGYYLHNVLWGYDYWGAELFKIKNLNLWQKRGNRTYVNGGFVTKDRFVEQLNMNL